MQAIADEHQDIIWAFGRNRPDSSKTDAHVPIHVKHGHATLNLNRTFSPPEDVVEPVDPPFGYPPLQPYQRTIVAHAVFSMAGYLVMLPAGALVARYMRTFSASWVSFHWIIQGVFGASSDIMLMVVVYTYGARHRWIDGVVWTPDR